MPLHEFWPWHALVAVPQAEVAFARVDAFALHFGFVRRAAVVAAMLVKSSAAAAAMAARVALLVCIMYLSWAEFETDRPRCRELRILRMRPGVACHAHYMPVGRGMHESNKPPATPVYDPDNTDCHNLARGAEPMLIDALMDPNSRAGAAAGQAPAAVRARLSRFM